MKASICSKYGTPDVLTVQEVQKPVAKDNEILIKVYAATANRTDLSIITGKPVFIRLFTGLSKPRKQVTGSDFVGIVEAVGEKVSTFKPGDRVMGFGGMGSASHAEYMVFPEKKAVLPIPANLDFETAVCCLEASYYAATAILQLKPSAGQDAMVYGATGAIGSAMIQFLKYFGLQVTAVCAGEHAARIQSLGADRIIDHKTTDFTLDEQRYDFVFDAVGKSSFARCKHLLKDKGIYCPTDGLVNFFYTLTTRFSNKKVAFKFPKDVRGTRQFITDLAAKKIFNPLIDRTYKLDEIAEAFGYVATKQKIGNVIIRITS